MYLNILTMKDTFKLIRRSDNNKPIIYPDV